MNEQQDQQALEQQQFEQNQHFYVNLNLNINQINGIIAALNSTKTETNSWPLRQNIFAQVEEQIKAAQESMLAAQAANETSTEIETPEVLQ